MSFTIKRRTLLSKTLSEALTKIIDHKFIDYKENLNAKRSLRLLDKTYKEVRNGAQELMEKYKDTPDDPDTTKIIDKWLDDEVKIESYKIRAEALNGIGFTFAETDSLEEIVDGLEYDGPKDVTNVTPINGPTL